MLGKIKVKERAAALLLEELKYGTEQWYYVSVVHVPTNTFVHGVMVPGKGPTDAWLRFHGLNLCPADCETKTMGPFEEEKVALVPENKRLCPLTKTEVENLGKEDM